MPANPDLFSQLEKWRLNTKDEFHKFITSIEFVELSQRRRQKLLPLRPSSVAVYRTMFGRLVRWVHDQGWDLFALNHEQLLAFLEHREQDQRVREGATVRRQYLTLVERIYLHLNIEPNPARHACFDISRERTRLAGNNAPTAALSEEQEQAFYDALPDAERDVENPMKGWKARRNRAMQALMLGGGLKVAEAMHLHTINVGDADDAGTITVLIPRPTPRSAVEPHETLLRPPASQVVLDWVAERRRLPLPGPYLFPATQRGEPMEKTQVYRYVKSTLTKAGINVVREGGRTLRNAYAVRELEQGQSEEEVGKRLGHRVARSIETYTNVVRNRKPTRGDGAT